MKQLFKLALVCTTMIASVMVTSCKDEPAPEFNITFTAANGTAKALVNNTETTKAKEGDVISIEATPAENYSFSRWTSTSSVAFGSATAATTTFTMPAANVNITAAFAVDLYVVNFTETYDGGTVEVKVADEAIESGTEVAVGADVTITASPATGYDFAGWGGVTLTNDNALTATFKMPAEAVTLTAAFDKVASVINFAATPEGGSVSVKVADEEIESGALVNIGANVTITATPAEGFSFTEWNGVTLTDNTALQATFAMPAEDVTLAAVFTEIPTYEITLPTVTGQGTVEVRVDGAGPISAGQKFYAGQSVNVKSIPAQGWKLASITILGATITEADYTLSMPASALAISDAIFEQLPPPPTQAPRITGPYGPIMGPFPEMLVLSGLGGQITLTCNEVAGATGYKWMDNNVAVQEGESRIFVITTPGKYTVCAYNEGGDGPKSVLVNVLQ